MHKELDMGDMCEASDDGKHWQLAKYLFYEDHNDEHICLVDDSYCQGYQHVRPLLDEL